MVITCMTETSIACSVGKRAGAGCFYRKLRRRIDRAEVSFAAGR
jgi:hypothetical protein